MLTYRTGAAGAPSAAMAMAMHLLEQTLPRAQAELAAYYQRGLTPNGARGPVLEAREGADHDVTTAEPRRDMDPRFAALLGLDPGRVPTPGEIANLLAGNRADGEAIPGKQVQRETKSLAEELGLDASRVPNADAVARVLEFCRADDGTPLPEDRARILRGRFLALYGVADPDGQLPPDAAAHIGAGRRADGSAQRLGPLLEGLSATRARIGYVDFCWSADKSVSLAWAMAPTEAERNLVAQAHKDAVASSLRYVEAELGRARKGRAGRDGYDPGKIGWVAFDHYASRPTVEVARRDSATGQAYTELVTLKVAGDPQLHTHVAVPNVVLTEDGRVGSLDLQRLAGRVHEFGALYHAYLATNLRRLGVEVALDEATGAARVTKIPERVRDAFSKRTRNGTDAARAYARSAGLDWDALDDVRKIGLAKTGVQGDPRQAKQDDLGDFASWRRQAAALRWRHDGVLGAKAEILPERDARIERAYEAAQKVFERSLQRRAVVSGSEARVAAARGLVASGVEGPEDIDAVMRAFATRGVRQDGKTTQLLWGVAADAQGQDAVRLTTTLQAERETEFLALARAAAADGSGALGRGEMDAAVARVGARTGDFEATAHGRAQRGVMDALGQGGKLAVAIGVAGAGKSTLLEPLVDAWQAAGKTVYGAALAWRQTDDLAAAGIPTERRAAMSVFLDRAGKGAFALGGESVVVVDELALLGTRQFLDLLRLQAAHGFALVAVGDPKQCQSVEAGPVVDLLRRALPDALPEILSTVRQQTESEREASLMFREGRAAEALAIKRENGTARLIAGDHRQVADGIAALWQERRDANAHDPGYTLSVSAPTNADARAIGAAIRARRQAAGELGEDAVLLSACDQAGDAYDLPLAVGDRVRLFARTNAAGAGRGVLGNNGSVLEVREIGAESVTLRNAQGREGRVAWNTLRDRHSGKIRLTYGDVLTINATQGLTSTEHIEAMPSGTRAVDGYKAYTAASRHRRATYLAVAEGAERREIFGRRPLGDPRPVSEADVWVNMGRNLSRQPEPDSALAFLERAHGVRQGAAAALQLGLQPAEQRAADGLAPTTVAAALQRRRVVARIAVVARAQAALAEGQQTTAEAFARVLPLMLTAVGNATSAAKLLVAQAARRVRARPEGVAARRQVEAVEAARAELLGLWMARYRQGQRRGAYVIDAGRERSWAEEALVEEGKQSALIRRLPEAELGLLLKGERMARHREEAREQARPKFQGPSPGM